jgi:hypothetical protein
VLRPDPSRPPARCSTRQHRPAAPPTAPADTTGPLLHPTPPGGDGPSPHPPLHPTPPARCSPGGRRRPSRLTQGSLYLTKEEHVWKHRCAVRYLGKSAQRSPLCADLQLQPENIMRRCRPGRHDARLQPSSQNSCSTSVSAPLRTQYLRLTTKPWLLHKYEGFVFKGKPNS